MICRVLTRVALIAVLAIGYERSRALGQPLGEDLPRASIRITAVGPFGDRIENPRMYLYTLDRKQDLAKNARRSTIKDVPYGSYILVVASSGGGIGQRLVSVNTPELWLRIGVSMPTGDGLWPGGDLTIRGAIKPAPQKIENWWVRVEGVFLHASREAPLKKGGTFSITGLEMGAYLLEVFEGGKLRHIRPVEIDPNLPITELTISLDR